SDDMMTLENVPDKIAIIGGGIIGLEFASLLSDLGSEVTVIEADGQIIPAEDKDMAGQLRKSLEDKGIIFKTEVVLSEDSIEKRSESVTLDIEGEKKSFDKLLVSIGRTPNVEDIGLNNTKIELDNGFIAADAHYQTKEKNIYAV